MKIARVFPRKTSMSPTDEDAYFGLPPFCCPQYDEVHISVTFTWDMERAMFISNSWMDYGKVRISGPAFQALLVGHPGEFTPNLYLKKGIVITSRGCPNNCHFCLVPKTEGPIRELKIHEGNNIADNNLLACSKEHIKKVFKMLQDQKSIKFSGGFEARRVTDEIIEQLRDLSIKAIWLAYDSENNKKVVQKACEKLGKYFTREQLRCYVLVGNKGDTIQKAESRLIEAWNMGTIPFAMRYRKPVDNFDDSFVYREREWNLLTREWTRPSITKAIMKVRNGENK